MALDGVFFDGTMLPRSNLSSPNITLTALLDTVSFPAHHPLATELPPQGNSLLRGPADVVAGIQATLGSQFRCAEPHTIAFQIGGKLFPVDARDFASQAFTDSAELCVSNLAPTDPPKEGSGYLYSWSLGDPFLKGRGVCDLTGNGPMI